MTQTTTNLIPAAGLKASAIANLPVKTPGALVVEMLTTAPGTGASAQPGLGIAVHYDQAEGMIALTPWPSLNMQAGDISHVTGASGVVIPDVELSAEIDITSSFPVKLSAPTAPRPPALTVKDGVPLILVAVNTHAASQRGWLAYDLQGKPVQY